MSRLRACVLGAVSLLLAGAPSALSGGTHLFGDGFRSLAAALFGGTGRNWFDFVDHLASNWLLPFSGLGIAWFCAWRLAPHARERAFKSGSRFARSYWGWVLLLRYFVPPAVVAIFLHAVGAI